MTGKILNKTEQKGVELEQLLSLAAWCVRKHRFYFHHTPKLQVVLPWPEQVRAVNDKDIHLRVRALLIDL